MIQSLLIELYYIFIWFASLKNEKAEKWIKGRELKIVNSNNLRNSVLVHCASYGEYEQAYPFIHAYHLQFPEKQIIVSFFSPSGFEKVILPPFVSLKVYLPKDRKSKLEYFFKELDIKEVFLVKYELWPQLLKTGIRLNIKMFLISSRFPKKHRIFTYFFKSTRGRLKRFEKIFVIDNYSKTVLENAGFNNVVKTGDTRFDKVIINSKSSKAFELNSTRPIILFGSIWKSDWSVLKPYLKELSQTYNCILAPHEVDLENLTFFEQELKNLSIEYDLWSDYKLQKHILIDTIGDLKFLYKYSSMAYIGGGFGKGLHNILEAIVFNQAVIIGTKYSSFPEVIEAVKTGIAYPLNSKGDFISLTQKALTTDKAKMDKYIKKHTGASQKIISCLK